MLASIIKENTAATRVGVFWYRKIQLTLGGSPAGAASRIPDAVGTAHRLYPCVFLGF